LIKLLKTNYRQKYPNLGFPRGCLRNRRRRRCWCWSSDDRAFHQWRGRKFWRSHL